MKPWIRKLHKWIGIASCLFMLLVASTALALNHRELWLKAERTTGGFSLAQARVWSADPRTAAHLLAADEHHLYQSRNGGRSWQELKLYVPAEHVSGIAFAPSGRLWVALRDAGLYASDDGEIWEEVADLPFDPVAGEAIEGLQAGADALYVRSSLGLYTYHPAAGKWEDTGKAQAQRAAGALSLQDWIWRLHTGRGFGPAVQLLYDAIALALILISLSGLALAWKPRRKTRRTPEAVAPAIDKVLR